jgi:hypothetical protein
MNRQLGDLNFVRAYMAYHPQTNGVTEKFNDSFINALRKHTVAHPADWDQWLPYILLAFRTRVHTTTGLTPIVLVTGKKVNSFKSWSCDDQEFEHALLERIKQLRNQVDSVAQIPFRQFRRNKQHK